MIISHKHRFIFIKTRKVAGSSIELRLSRLLEPTDVFSSLQERSQSGGFENLKSKQFHGFDKAGRPIFISGHSPLERVYRKYGKLVADYRVISVERNPWDRAVSQFFWSNRKTDMKTRSHDEQVAEFKKFTYRYGPDRLARKLFGWRKHRAHSQRNLYSLGETPIVDFMIRFECLEEDLARLSGFLELDETLSVKDINAKGEFRAKKSRDYRLFFDTETKDLVGNSCAWEIENLGYGFDPTIPPVLIPDPMRTEVKARFLAKHI